MTLTSASAKLYFCTSSKNLYVRYRTGYVPVWYSTWYRYLVPGTIMDRGSAVTDPTTSTACILDSGFQKPSKMTNKLMMSRKHTIPRHLLSQRMLAFCLALSFLQFASAWTSKKELLNRRNVLEFAGWSTLATFAPPSFAEEAIPEVEVIPIGDAKKVNYFYLPCIQSYIR
jgi:hypothetical protein